MAQKFEDFCLSYLALRPVRSNNIGGLTPTTPTLTPTTLKNLADHLLELRGGIPPPPIEHEHQAGFVPPLLSGFINYSSSNVSDSSCSYDSLAESDDSVSQNYAMDFSNEHSDSSETESSIKRKQSTLRLRKLGEEHKLTPEEQEKLRIRRERNKEAAARCRKRRLDHTNNLLAQTRKLEEEKKSLQKEIDFLENQKTELEFYLKVHKSKCQYALPDLDELKK